MTNVLPTLDQSQPLDGDIETVHELAVAHEVGVWLVITSY